jgi:hypothetical protein
MQLNLVLGRRHNLIRKETVFLLQLLQWGGRAKRVHSDSMTFDANESLPAKRRCLFHGHPGGDRRREDRFTIRRVLAAMVLEHLPGRHADNTRFDSFRFKLLVRLHAHGDLAPGGQQQDVGTAARRVGQNVRAPAQPLLAVVLPLAGELLHQRARAELVAALHMVDYVVTTDETDAAGLIESLKPAVLVRLEEADARRIRQLTEHVHRRQNSFSILVGDCHMMVGARVPFILEKFGGRLSRNAVNASFASAERSRTEYSSFSSFAACSS